MNNKIHKNEIQTTKNRIQMFTTCASKAMNRTSAG